uniref:Uncharacterized protein n=1 Tax=Rhipicephalus microplus TaxID=6941 RepID=A0A6G5A3C6_RHIMP
MGVLLSIQSSMPAILATPAIHAAPSGSIGKLRMRSKQSKRQSYTVGALYDDAAREEKRTAKQTSSQVRHKCQLVNSKAMISAPFTSLFIVIVGRYSCTKHARCMHPRVSRNTYILFRYVACERVRQ